MGRLSFLFNLGGDSQPLVMLDVSSAPVDPSQSLVVPSLLIYHDRDKVIFDLDAKLVKAEVQSTTDLGRRLCENLCTADRRQEMRESLGIAVHPAAPHVTLISNPGLYIMGRLVDAAKPGTLVDQLMHPGEQAQHPNPAASADAICTRFKAKRAAFGEYYDLSTLKPAADRHLVFYVLCMGDWFRSHWPQDNPDFVFTSDPSLLSSSDGVIVSLPDCCDTRSAVDEMQKLFDWAPLFIVDEPLWSLADWDRLGSAYLGSKQNPKPTILLVDYYRYCLLQRNQDLCDKIKDDLGGNIQQVTLTRVGTDLRQALFHLFAILDLFWEIENPHSILRKPDGLSFSIMDSCGFPIRCNVVLLDSHTSVDCPLEITGTNGQLWPILGKRNGNCYKGLLTGLRQAVPDRFEGLLTPNGTCSILPILDSFPGGLL